VLSNPSNEFMLNVHMPGKVQRYISVQLLFRRKELRKKSCILFKFWNEIWSLCNTETRAPPCWYTFITFDYISNFLVTDFKVERKTENSLMLIITSDVISKLEEDFTTKRPRDYVRKLKICF
jgi:hypothetical protein